MKLKPFDNIDLSTPEKNKEFFHYLEDLSCDHNICENTPDEIITCADSMLKVIGALMVKYLVLCDKYYSDSKANKRALIKHAEDTYWATTRYLFDKREYISKAINFGGGADAVIPEIRNLARKLEEFVAAYHIFSVKVVDYAVLLVI